MGPSSSVSEHWLQWGRAAPSDRDPCCAASREHLRAGGYRALDGPLAPTVPVPARSSRPWPGHHHHHATRMLRERDLLSPAHVLCVWLQASLSAFSLSSQAGIVAPSRERKMLPVRAGPRGGPRIVSPKVWPLTPLGRPGAISYYSTGSSPLVPFDGRRTSSSAPVRGGRRRRRRGDALGGAGVCQLSGLWVWSRSSESGASPGPLHAAIGCGGRRAAIQL